EDRIAALRRLGPLSPDREQALAEVAAWVVERPPPDALRATAGLAASGYDLLTVVMHELGHVLGLDDVNPAVDPNGLMSETLPLGTRHLIDAVSAAPGGAYAAGEDSLAGWGLLPGVWVG
ncbi:MAG: hypothetical protein J0H99_17385, partial [Rhodospirillales bacterium]|nr:hypothetical protein [Rhodospirillales bacterium]